MSKRTCNITSLMINLTVFIVVAFAVAHNFRTDIIREEVEWLDFTGWQNLRYYTTLSNILCGISALITLIFNVKNSVKDKFEFPSAVIILNFVASVSIAVTFTTVALFLSPLTILVGHGYFALFEGNGFFMHFLVPALVILNFVIFLRGESIGSKYIFFAITPTLLYAIVYYFCVLQFKCWPDFYNFTLSGNFWAIPLFLTVMSAVVFGLSFGIFYLRKKTAE